jgi:5'(3')-deoxyribonucleotidase
MLNGKPVVLLDVDDVVCRCIQGMAKETGELLGRDILEEEVKTWDFHKTFGGEELEKHIEAKMSEKGWCFSLEPFPGAVEGVKWLMEIAEVFFVTAPFHGEHWPHERRVWLYKNFGVDRDRVIQAHAKFLVRGELFIDDKIKNLEEWWKYGDGSTRVEIPAVWDRPHNREMGKFVRFHNWDEVYDYVKRTWP